MKPKSRKIQNYVSNDFESFDKARTDSDDSMNFEEKIDKINSIYELTEKIKEMIPSNS